MESVKQLFQVFTNKQLLLEWLLEVNIAIGKMLCNKIEAIKVDKFAETNTDIDMRTAPQAIKNNMIHDEAVLNMRWDLCSSCEFLTEKNSCEKCGCFMKVKHKLAQASCPVGKWGAYTEEKRDAITSAI